MNKKANSSLSSLGELILAAIILFVILVPTYYLINWYSGEDECDNKAVFNDLYDWLDTRLPGFQKGPLEVVCGTLNVEENKARGAMPRSRHLLGEAIDVRPIPNYDDSKCIIATFAESIIVQKKLGSEIAIKWGIDGHVHIALHVQQMLIVH